MGFNGLRAVALTVLLLGCAFSGLVGCGAGNGGSTDLSAAREFPGYLLYYAGHEVEGESLSYVAGPADQGPAKGWTFIYGDCTPSGGEGGCPAPVEIQNFPICRRWPAAYPWEVPLFDFHGAKATRRAGGTIEIYTGRTAIAIFTSGISARAVARRRRMVGSQKPATRFPSPQKGSLTGDLPCQKKPG